MLLLLVVVVVLVIVIVMGLLLCLNVGKYGLACEITIMTIVGWESDVCGCDGSDSLPVISSIFCLHHHHNDFFEFDESEVRS
jgi:hypothetical protein